MKNSKRIISLLLGIVMLFANVNLIFAAGNDEIGIKNNTAYTILLNNLKQREGIQLISGDNKIYYADKNKVFVMDLIISPYEEALITLRFPKSIGLTESSNVIKIINVIKNYDTYIQDSENYKDKTDISIRLED